MKEGRHRGPPAGHVGDSDEVSVFKPGLDENINHSRSPSTGSTHRLSNIDKRENSIDHISTYPTSYLQSCLLKHDTSYKMDWRRVQFQPWNMYSQDVPARADIIQRVQRQAPAGAAAAVVV